MRALIALCVLSACASKAGTLALSQVPCVPECGEGERCVNSVCKCDPQSCEGCCQGDTCVAPSDSACGLGGVQCGKCSGLTGTCISGQCSALCSPAAACKNGCCAGDTCGLGTEDTACGAAGQACVDCTTGTQGFHCINGACGCSEAQHCPLGFACDFSTGHCSQGCSATQLCNGGCCNAGVCGACGSETACLNGVDDDGDGLSDCADPECAPDVECVDDPGASATVGYVAATGGCITEYSLESQLGNGVDASNPCPGCSCSAVAHCRMSVSAWSPTSNTTCSNAANASFTVDIDNVSSSSTGNNCLPSTIGNVAPIQLGSYKIAQSLTLLSGTCAMNAATPTLRTATFTNGKTFCAASQKSTSCGPGKVCVKRQPSPLCVKLPGSGQTCPSAFSANSQSYFQTILDQRTCNACSTGACTTTSNGTCPPISAAQFVSVRTSTCVNGVSGGGDLLGDSISPSAPRPFPMTTYAGCTNYGQVPYYATFVSSVWQEELASGWSPATCAVSAQPTTSGAAPTQTDPATVCCRP